MLVILGSCRAYFGNRLHSTSSWIKVCIQSGPHWLASQCAMLGYTTDGHCWFAYQYAVLIILDSCRAYFGNRLHSTNAWIRFVFNWRLASSRPSVPCWDILRIAIAGLLSSVPCWLFLVAAGPILAIGSILPVLG